MNLHIFRIKIQNLLKYLTVGTTSQILEKLAKSEHPFRYEFNHTKFIQFRYQMDLQILIFRFWKVLQKFQFLPSKSEINDEYRHGFVKYNHFWL